VKTNNCARILILPNFFFFHTFCQKKLLTKKEKTKMTFLY